MSASFMRKLVLGTATAVVLMTLTAGCGNSTAKTPPAGGSGSHSKTSAPGGSGSAF